MNCKIDPNTLRCRVCGARVSAAHVRRNCVTPRPGLGDYVAKALDAVGITPARVEAVVGGPCGCAERQEKLNEIGAKYLGIGRVDPPA